VLSLAETRKPYEVRPVDRVIWVREPRVPRRTSRLTVATVRSDPELAPRIQAVLRADPEWSAASSRVAQAQVRLRRLASDAQWQAYLELEEREVARWDRALTVVARWAFEGGRASRRRS